LTPGTPVSGTLSPANATDAYQFSAGAGASFYFPHISAGSGSTSWRLTDPYGGVLFFTGLSSDGGRLTLNATGTYTVLIEGGIGRSEARRVGNNVTPVTDPAPQALTPGGTVSASLAAPGQRERYAFKLAAYSL